MNERQNMAAHRSWECHSVYWEMISELPDRITLQSLQPRSPVMEDHQSWKCLALQEELKLYCIWESACVCQTIPWEWVMWKSSFDTRQAFLLRWDRIGYFTCICTACDCASAGKETRVDRDHHFLKDFSHEKSSSWNTVLLFSPSPAERLGCWFVLRLEAMCVCFSYYLWRSKSNACI